MLTKLSKLREEREQGFTLIELLVVILIIGILAAISIPAFMKQRKSAVDSTVESDLTSIAKAVEAESVKLKGQPAQVSGDTSLGQPLQVGDKVIPLNDLKSTEDTDLKLEGSLGGNEGYTITGINKNGDEAGAGIVYSSVKGGLVKGESGSNEAPSAGGAFTYSGTFYNYTGYTPTNHTFNMTVDKASGSASVVASDKNQNGELVIGTVFSSAQGDIKCDSMPFASGGKASFSPLTDACERNGNWGEFDPSEVTGIKKVTAQYDYGYDYEG